MFLASGIYALFVSTNYWERYYTLVPSAAAIGVAIVPFWASLGNYITRWVSRSRRDLRGFGGVAFKPSLGVFKDLPGWELGSRFETGLTGSSRLLSDCVSWSESSADLMKLLFRPRRGANAGKGTANTCTTLNPAVRSRCF